MSTTHEGADHHRQAAHHHEKAAHHAHSAQGHASHAEESAKEARSDAESTHGETPCLIRAVSLSGCFSLPTAGNWMNLIWTGKHNREADPQMLHNRTHSCTVYS